MSFKELVDGSITQVGNQIIALLYALCFLFFLVGMVRLFFSTNAESRDNGRKFAIYSLIGIVVLFTLWGFVRFALGVLSSFAA